MNSKKFADQTLIIKRLKMEERSVCEKCRSPSTYFLTKYKTGQHLCKKHLYEFIYLNQN